MEYEVTVCPEVWAKLTIEADSVEDAQDKAYALLMGVTLNRLMDEYAIDNEIIVGDNAVYKAGWKDVDGKRHTHWYDNGEETYWHDDGEEAPLED